MHHHKYKGSHRHKVGCAPTRASEQIIRSVDQASQPAHRTAHRVSDLKLRGYEHGGGADQLKHLSVDWSLGQVMVCHLNSQVQSLMVKLKVLLNQKQLSAFYRLVSLFLPVLISDHLTTTHLHFNQPVNQDRPHLCIEVGLHGHVVRQDKLFLKIQKTQGTAFRRYIHLLRDNLNPNNLNQSLLSPKGEMPTDNITATLNKPHTSCQECKFSYLTQKIFLITASNIKNGVTSLCLR